MTIPESIYQRAIDFGFTKEAACVLLAQIQGESAFRSNNAEDRIHASGISDEEYLRRANNGLMTYNGKNFIYDGVGFGYAQWTYWSRKKKLLEYCQDRHVSLDDHEAQKEFLFYEMQVDFPGIWTLCHNSHDMTKLMEDLVCIWENPADHAGAIAVRSSYAQAWLAKFSGWEVPTATDAPTPMPIEEKTKLETWPPRTIALNLNWEETFLAQALLKCHGYNVVVNGIFSESFEQKVKEFQRDHNLLADGIIGPKTWAALMKM